MTRAFTNLSQHQYCKNSNLSCMKRYTHWNPVCIDCFHCRMNCAGASHRGQYSMNSTFASLVVRTHHPRDRTQCHTRSTLLCSMHLYILLPRHALWWCRSVARYPGTAIQVTFAQLPDHSQHVMELSGSTDGNRSLLAHLSSQLCWTTIPWSLWRRTLW